LKNVRLNRTHVKKRSSKVNFQRKPLSNLDALLFVFLAMSTLVKLLFSIN